MTRGNRSLRIAVSIGVGVLALYSIHSNWQSIRRVPASDFYQFWVVGRELQAGRGGNVYAAGERARIGDHYLELARRGGEPIEIRTARQRETLETFSTPFLYTVFASFSSSDYDRDLTRFRILGLTSTLLAVVVFCRILGHGAISTIVALALIGSWFAPTRSDWFVGNVNGLQLGLLALFLWVSGRYPNAVGFSIAGFVLGMSAMFKPNTSLAVAALLLAWAMRRSHEKVLYVGGGIGVAVIVALAWSSQVFDGPSIWRNWFVALSALPDEIITVDLGNYAAPRLLSDWLGFDPSIAIGLACGGIVLGVMTRVFAGAREETSPDRAGLEDLHVVALASLVTLLASPLAWLHYYVAAIPMLLVVLGPRARFVLPGAARRIPPRVARAAAAIALVGIMMRPLVVLDVGDDRSRAALLCLGTLMLFGLGVLSMFGLRGTPKSDRDVGT